MRVEQTEMGAKQEVNLSLAEITSRRDERQARHTALQENPASEASTMVPHAGRRRCVRLAPAINEATKMKHQQRQLKSAILQTRLAPPPTTTPTTITTLPATATQITTSITTTTATPITAITTIKNQSHHRLNSKTEFMNCRLAPSARHPCTTRAGSRRSTTKISGESLISLIILVSLGLASVTLASDQQPASSSGGGANGNSNQQDLKQNSNERMDSSSGGGGGYKEPAARSEQSIVASLSSAVATAAAAAAVAAAQAHSMSPSDARSSLAAHAHQQHHHHQQSAHGQRSPGLHLAIKLADAIPEVPYNILHNMKKLDHAAPFYNVPNGNGGASKMSLGPGKELSALASAASSVVASAASGSSTSPGGTSLLGSALLSAAGSSGAHHASRLGGAAAEQLGLLFRSPLWKRLADGYDDFASEFRSLFRGSQGGHSHGASSSTSASSLVGPSKASLTGSSSVTAGKLLRDISVPALLVLLASSLSGAADWRPVRTRRKAFVPEDQLSAITGLQRQPEALLTSNSNSDHFVPPQTSPNNFETVQTQAQQLRLAPNQQFHHEPVHQTLQPSAGDISFQMDAGRAWPQLANRNLHHHHHQQQQQQQQHLHQPRQLEPVLAERAPASSQFVQPTGFDSDAGNLSPQPPPAQYFQQLQATDFAPSPAQPMKRLGDLSVSVQQQPLDKRSDGGAYHPSPPLDVSAQLTSMAAQEPKLKHVGKLLASSFSKFIQTSDKLHANSGQFVAAPSSPAYGLLASPASTARNEKSPSFLAGQWTGAKRLLARAWPQRIIFDDATALQVSRRQSSAEQRDLTKLLPESWREVVKRTMSTVQQQANAQWKVVEGQLAGWVQDKLRTAAAAPATVGANATGASAAPVSKPAVSNIIASVSSSALNILGLNKSPQQLQASSAAVSTDRSSSAGGGDPNAASTPSATAAASQRGKPSEERAPANKPLAQPARASLVGVASKLASSIRSPASSSSSSISSPAPSPGSSSPSSTSVSISAPAGANQQRLNGESGSVASQYPTVTSDQANSSDAARGSAPNMAE